MNELRTKLDVADAGLNGFQRPRAGVRRAREGRLLGGVCAGLPGRWGLGTNGWRLLFLITALCAGVGAVVYIACWTVIPLDRESEEETGAGPRAAVVLAWATGALILLLLVAGAAGAATMFGFGWVMFALAGIVLVASLTPAAGRIPSAITLLGIGALTLPSVAVALSPLRLSLQVGSSVVRPASAAELESTVYASGFGTMLIDLRDTPLPAAGTLSLRVQAGLRRTIVALPANRCVRVQVDYDVHPFADQLATLLDGRQQTPFDGVVLFGNVYGYQGIGGDPQGTAASGSSGHGPLLVIHFSSQGGGLYVRDYPDSVSPDLQPNWPGFVVTPEPRPNLVGSTPRQQQVMLRAWHQRLIQQLDNRATINQLRPGPCAS